MSGPPDVSGKAIDEARAAIYSRNVPALALTALARDEDRRHSAEAGFQVHMAKPVDIDRLVAALARMREGVIGMES